MKTTQILPYNTNLHNACLRLVAAALLLSLICIALSTGARADSADEKRRAMLAHVHRVVVVPAFFGTETLTKAEAPVSEAAQPIPIERVCRAVAEAGSASAYAGSGAAFCPHDIRSCACGRSISGVENAGADTRETVCQQRPYARDQVRCSGQERGSETGERRACRRRPACYPR